MLYGGFQIRFYSFISHKLNPKLFFNSNPMLVQLVTKKERREGLN